MSIAAKYEYFQAIYDRYQSASKKEKKIILDEFCNNCNYNRKYAIRLLNSAVETKSVANLSRRGRKKIYDDAIIETILTDIWKATNLPCSKRLKYLIPLWLPFYKKQKIAEPIQHKLLTISAATIDRIMAPSRAKFSKQGLATTKPGSILKKQVAIKTDQWDEQQPGFLEADTVAHCGTSTAGMFVYTINCVDIATQWTEQRASWGKSEKNVLMAIRDMEQHLPFTVKGFDTDNGSEFLNWHLVRHFQQRKHPVQFTRARPYKKNDNAHIENKNWTHVRQYLGYQRFDNPELVAMLNNLYRHEWNLYFNFFNNSFKLIEKKRVKSKIIKKFDVPKTPFQRIMESEFIPAETKQRLQRIIDNIDPFELEQRMAHNIKAIIKKATNRTI